MNFYDKRLEGEGGGLPALGPGLQSLAMGLVKQLHENRQRRGMEDAFKQAGVPEEYLSLLARTGGKEQPLMMRILGATELMKNGEGGENVNPLVAATKLSSLGGDDKARRLELQEKEYLRKLANDESTRGYREKKLGIDTGLKNVEQARKIEKDVVLERDKIQKANAKYTVPLSKARPGLEKAVQALKVLKDIDRSGKLNSPTAMSAIGMGNALFGGRDVFGQFRTPDTVLYESELKSLISEGIGIFKGTTTGKELEIIEKMLPGLMSNPQGRALVIAGYEDVLNLKQKEYEIKDQIIAENNGFEPSDLEGKVKERLAPYKAQAKNLEQLYQTANTFGGEPTKSYSKERSHRDGEVRRKNGQIVIYRNGKWVKGKKLDNGKFVNA